MEPISIDYDDYGVNSDPMASDISDPCVQYMSMGRKIPYEYIDYLAKIIVQLESAESVGIFYCFT
uniref:ATP-dependent DNA helicase n=1 Tax=Heterorhabditis bacteriophora TaxID=37862 RepID=A0A1I7XGP4_HETBA